MRREKAAKVLLTLLRGHVMIADEWESYYERVFAKNYANGEEAKAKEYITETLAGPFLKKARDRGFPFAVLLDIIPVAFETTAYDRGRMLASLEELVAEEYASV